MSVGASVDIDYQLSGHPVFADHHGILGRVFETYDFLLEVRGPEFPRCAVDGTSRIAQDFAFDVANRRWLDELIHDLVDGSRRAELVAELAASAAVSQEGLLTAEAAAAGSRVRLATPGGGIDVVAQPDLPRRGHQRLQELYRAHLDGGQPDTHELVAPTPMHMAAIERAAALLGSVLPRTAEVLSHIRQVAVVDGPGAFESASTREVPGVVFVSAHAFRTPLKLAEALLHEAVHHRIYDLQVTRSILTADYDTTTAGTVSPPWHPLGTAWAFDRALAAAHVYVHLTGWFTALATHPAGEALGPDGVAVARERAATRARLLLDDVLALAPRHLGPAGRAFVAWLGEVCDEPATVHDPIGRR